MTGRPAWIEAEGCGAEERGYRLGARGGKYRTDGHLSPGGRRPWPPLLGAYYSPGRALREPVAQVLGRNAESRALHTSQSQACMRKVPERSGHTQPLGKSVCTAHSVRVSVCPCKAQEGPLGHTGLGC